MAGRRAVRDRPLPNRAELESALGYRFRDPAWLEQALTHSSMTGMRGGVTRSNERLEFLGDRVLGLVVAHLLVERFPDDAEGALTQRQVAMVRTESLAAVAAGLDLGRWLKTAPGEIGAGGTLRTSLLADGCEALIGAIYLDGGFAAAQEFIARLWAPLLETVRVPPRDAKMALQEWAHAHGPEVPAYRVVEVSGPAHATTFTVEARLGAYPPRMASGSTKRAAERAAAGLLLADLEASSDG